MNTNKLGTIGELKAITSFVEQGFSIYAPLSGKEHYDFIACKDNLMLRIQVKSTSVKTKSGSYSAMLKSVRPNRSKSILLPFDNTKSDILVVYISIKDTLCFVKTSEVKTVSSLTFRELPSNSTKNNHLISDYCDLSKVIKKFK